jgi:hypothetical protein
MAFRWADQPQDGNQVSRTPAYMIDIAKRSSAAASLKLFC